MGEVTEAEAVEYIAKLARLEREPGSDRAYIRLGPFTAFTLIGALQLATRHPEMSQSQRDLIGAVIDQLRPLFAGTPGEALLELGDNPAFDIERECQHPFGPHSPKCPPGGHPGFAAEENADGTPE
jgi:hypothetical protein